MTAALTRAEEARRVSGFSSPHPETARDAFDAFADDVAALRGVAEVLVEHDLADVASAVAALHGGLAPLAPLGLLAADTVRELEETATWFGLLSLDEEALP